MSEDIPEAPISYRLYSWLRNKLSPSYDAYYLIIESVLIATTLGILLFTQFNPNPINLAPLIFLVIIGSLFFIFTPPDKRTDIVKLMDISMPVHLIITASGIGLSYGVAYYLEIMENTVFVVMSAIGAYSAMQIVRSRKYSGDRDYYTDEFSSVNEKWKRASVALEQAIENNKQDNEMKAYYWSKRGEKLYEDIVEEDDRVMPRQAAGAFSAACGFVAASVFTDGNESYSLWKAAEESISRANEYLSIRVCDNCGRKEEINKCKHIMSDDGRVIICQRCYQKEASRQRDSNRKSSRSTSSESNRSRSSNKNENKKEDKNNKRTSRSRRDSGTHTGSNRKSSRSNSNEETRVHRDSRSAMTEDEALEMLGVDNVNSSSEVHEAFRAKVKDAHPDMGGSEEEFKKVKQAREVLLDKL